MHIPATYRVVAAVSGRWRLEFGQAFIKLTASTKQAPEGIKLSFVYFQVRTNKIYQFDLSGKSSINP